MLAVAAAHPGITTILRSICSAPWVQSMAPVRHDIGPWELDAGHLWLLPEVQHLQEPGAELHAVLSGLDSEVIPSILDMSLGMLLALPSPLSWVSVTGVDAEEKLAMHAAIAVFAARLLEHKGTGTSGVRQHCRFLADGMREGSWRLRRHVMLHRWWKRSG